MKYLLTFFFSISITTILVPVNLLAMPGPAIHAKRTRKDRVNIRFTLGRKAFRNSTALDLYRKKAGSSDFTRVTHLTSLKKKGNYIDSPSDDGRYLYRARTQSTNGYSKWSKIVKLRIKPSKHTPPRTPLAEGQTACSRKYITQVLRLVNEAREAEGRDPLKKHKQLSWSAREHALDIATSGNFSHDGWLDFIRASGFKNSYAGENIAYGYSSPSSVMNAWLNSTGHRNNILNSNFRYLGIGCIYGRGSIWWVQNFGG